MTQRTMIDARGSFCPGPLMEVIAALKLLEVGDEIEVWSTDKGTTADLPEWCKKVGHEMVASEECDEGYYRLVVRKAK